MPGREFFWLSHLKWEDPPKFHTFEGEKTYFKSTSAHMGEAFVKDMEEACTYSQWQVHSSIGNRGSSRTLSQGMVPI